MPTPHRRRAGLTALATAVAAAAVLTAAAPAAATHPRPADPAPTVVSYSEDETVIANPARGFYRHTETHSRADGSGWTPLTADALAAFRAEGVSQILRVVYLERYVDADLDAALLDALAADFATARAAGVSVILRFAYAQGGDWPYSPPYGDASPERVLAHIEQLTPLLQANADVIAVVQNGFIGLWGEGYYTDHFVADPADPGVVTDEDWEARASVLDALLEALPDTRMVQVRTMQWKQRTLDRPTGAEGALPAENAYDGSALARVGHHNDCFLASPDDFGTFLSDPITLDQEYLEAETRFLPMGGETCTVSEFSGWESAEASLARYHYSYLNRDYNQDVLGSWGAENLTEVAKQLGYRFVLEQSRVVDGDHPSLEIDVRNEGWAAPYNPRPVSVVLDSAAGSVSVPLDIDARTWAPGESVTLTVPLDEVPAGSYSASLALPAPEASIAADPRFAIRTANVGTWNAERGLNQLQQEITIGSVPKAVSKPSVRVSRDDVRVTWHPARGSSAAPVTGYAVTLTSSSGQVLTQAAATDGRSVTFSDVPAGRWRATVVATNAVGSSDASKPSATAVVHRSHHHR